MFRPSQQAPTKQYYTLDRKANTIRVIPAKAQARSLRSFVTFTPVALQELQKMEAHLDTKPDNFLFLLPFAEMIKDRYLFALKNPKRSYEGALWTPIHKVKSLYATIFSREEEVMSLHESIQSKIQKRVEKEEKNASVFNSLRRKIKASATYCKSMQDIQTLERNLTTLIHANDGAAALPKRYSHYIVKVHGKERFHIDTRSFLLTLAKHPKDASILLRLKNQDGLTRSSLKKHLNHLDPQTKGPSIKELWKMHFPKKPLLTPPHQNATLQKKALHIEACLDALNTLTSPEAEPLIEHLLLQIPKEAKRLKNNHLEKTLELLTSLTRSHFTSKSLFIVMLLNRTGHRFACAEKLLKLLEGKSSTKKEKIHALSQEAQNLGCPPTELKKFKASFTKECTAPSRRDCKCTYRRLRTKTSTQAT